MQFIQRDKVVMKVSSGGHNTSVCNHPHRPTQPTTLSGTGNEYRPKCGDALRLGWYMHGLQILLSAANGKTRIV